MLRLDCNMHILNIILWNSGPCLNPVDNANIFVSTGDQHGLVQATSSNMASMGMALIVQFSKSLLCYLNLSQLVSSNNQYKT